MQELTTTSVSQSVSQISSSPTSVTATTVNSQPQPILTSAPLLVQQNQLPEKKNVRPGNVRNNRNETFRDNGPNVSGGSVIGSMTTWHPPTANLTSSRSQLDINVSPPQSIAIVAGRKYIMVPKTNLMSVSPSGEVKIGDNNGIPLPYFDNSIQHPVSQASSTLHHQFK